MANITFMGAGSSVFAKNILGDAMLSPALHDAHKSHPTLAGSYLAAGTFQWTLFGAPVGEPEAAAGIPQQVRTALRDAARRVCEKRT